MNIDFNLNTFLNIIENIFSNDIITYIIPKKDNFNTFGKILPIFDESRNYSEELSQDLLQYKILNNNKKLNDYCNSALNNEFNSSLNNESNESLNNDKYKFKYDIENGLYDIEIGYISLMENSFYNKDEDSYSKNDINEKSNIYEYNKDKFDNIHVIDCFDNEDI